MMARRASTFGSKSSFPLGSGEKLSPSLDDPEGLGACLELKYVADRFVFLSVPSNSFPD
jgi:hypothetical protein